MRLARILFLAFLNIGLAACTDETRRPGVDAAAEGGADADTVDATQDVDAGADAMADATADAIFDATADAADMGPDAPIPTGPVLYPEGDRHSPIPAELAGSLAALSTRDRDDDGIMKVGDSITVSRGFLYCFAGAGFDLDGRELTTTVERFGGFDRESLAARVGWSASAPLMGSPTPLEQEMAATRARFATLMFGTNDAGFRPPQDFARDVWTIVDALLTAGTIPLMSTIPARLDMAEADARVRPYNLAVRAIAQGRGVPLVDLHSALMPLPNQGLGGDGVHPTSDSRGACRLDPAGLESGYNMRNLLTLEQLDRAARALDGTASDATAMRLVGAGTEAQPYEADVLPFVFMGDTRTSISRALDDYPCGTSAEAGAEEFYRLEVAAPMRLTVRVLSKEGVDVDVYLLRGDPTAASCVDRDDTVVSADIEAGTYWVVVDTFSGGAGERPGEYLVLIDEG